jgi:hypothetical protein
VGQISVMVAEKGDERLEWDPNDKDSVQKAQILFDHYKEKGHKAYKVEYTPSRSGEEVTEFDPDEKEIIMAPAMSGG